MAMNLITPPVKAILTQKKGDLTDDEQAIIKKSPLVFGCDVCQEVCPHNKDLSTTPIIEFQSTTLCGYCRIRIDDKQGIQSQIWHRAFSWRGKKILIRNQEYINKP